MENQINFIQIQKDNEEHLKIASSLWVPFICEVNEHDGTYEDEEKKKKKKKKRSLKIKSRTASVIKSRIVRRNSVVRSCL